jgi:PTH1 family peptidyl-tRNA hydrolase
LRNIIHLCGSSFLRIRIGIGHPQKKDVIDYVLSKPTVEESIDITLALGASVEAVEDMMNLGVAKAMDILHSNPV